VGWYKPWALTSIHFHPRRSGSTKGFGHGGYCIGDGRYGYVSHQQDRKTLGQENWIVQNAKPDHPVSLKIAAIPGRQHKQGVPKDGSSIDESGSS
jgi:hypothetical protein